MPAPAIVGRPVRWKAVFDAPSPPVVPKLAVREGASVRDATLVLALVLVSSLLVDVALEVDVSSLSPVDVGDAELRVVAVDRSGMLLSCALVVAARTRSTNVAWCTARRRDERAMLSDTLSLRTRASVPPRAPQPPICVVALGLGMPFASLSPFLLCGAVCSLLQQCTTLESE